MCVNSELDNCNNWKLFNHPVNSFKKLFKIN